MSVPLDDLPDPLRRRPDALVRARGAADAAGMRDALEEICEIVDRHTVRPRRPGLLERIGLYRDAVAPQGMAGIFPPMMAMIVRGAKEVSIGDRVLRYDPASYFIATVELPASGCLRLDRGEDAFLSVSLELDGERLARLLPDAAGNDDAAARREEAGFGVDAVTPALLDAWLRMLRLLDAPGDAAALAPLCEQEILYRLLRGPRGAMLRQITRKDSRLSRVRRAIALIRDGFDRPVRTEALAEAAGMSVASLHRHFRAATAMSPLQYQKALRLQEARRLLLSGREVGAAAYAVGYESASQFSREYARMFGVPPSRDGGRDGARDGVRIVGRAEAA